VTFTQWCDLAMNARATAEDEANNPYDVKTHELENNAFKHAYWFALVAKAGVSEDAALLLGAAHEIGPGKSVK
jgi:hypothetical protein